MTSPLSGPVRVRFAPSPTGFLHVGGARTAIYNDLLRQNLGGVNILRIEDTDRERSSAAMTAQIKSALAWLGIHYDEGPFLQSERVERHRQRAWELVEKGRAYRCFCSPEVLDAGRAVAQAKGEMFRYPRTCLALSPDEVARRVAANEPSVVRFRLPDVSERLHDLVRGDVEFGPEAVDDFILLRSDGSPTYHLSVVVDDVDMAVTVVIRGDDHLTNTAKHIPLFRAFDAPAPAFGHLPLILGADRKRLSKRTGATSVEEFRELGILPVALYNFLALLGWNPGDDRELMTRDEMAALFSTAQINASAAIFDLEKLHWMNHQYIQRLSLHDLRAHLMPFLAAQSIDGVDPARLDVALDLHRPRARTLAEWAEQVAPYFRDDVHYDEAAASAFKATPTAATLANDLETLAARFAATPSYSKTELEAALRVFSEEKAVKAAAFIHPTRMATTGSKAGAPLFDVLELLGEPTVSARVANFAAWLRAGDTRPPS